MNQKTAQILLASVIIARSTSFMFSKIILQHMGKYNLLSLRFLMAFIILVFIFRKRILKTDKITILKGALLGFSFFLVMSAELEGLKHTNTSTVSFLENTSIILVPLFESFLRKKFPKLSTLFGCLLAFSGIGLITLKDNISISTGETYSIIAAIFYAITIIIGDRVSKKSDPLLIGIFQVGFLGLFSAIATSLLESPTIPSNYTEWINIIILAIVCTGFGFTLQPVAQKYVSSEKSGLFCALSIVSASAFGVIFLNEKLGTKGLLGAVIILFSIFLPSILENMSKKSHLNKTIIKSNYN